MTETTTTGSSVTNQFIASGVTMLNEQIEAANKLAGIGERVANVNKQVFELRDDENTDDPKIAAFQKWFDKANDEILKRQAAIEDYIRTEKLADAAEPEDVEKAAIQHKAFMDTIKATKDVLSKLNGGNVPDGVAEVKTFPGARKSGGGNASTGVKRPRFKSVQYRVAGSNEWVMASAPKRDAKGKIVEGQTTSSFTVAALAINKVEGSKLVAADFHGPLFDIVGHNTDLSTMADKEITFVISVGTGDKAKNYEIQAIPQAA